MSARLRLLAFGLVAGLLLSLSQVPAGLSWTGIPAASGLLRSFAPAAALVVIGLLLDPARSAFVGQPWRGTGTWLAAAAAVGFALHALLLQPPFEPATRFALVGTLLVGASLLVLLAGRRRHAAPTESVPWVERGALLLVGAGFALAALDLAGAARQFGHGLPEDDAVIATTFAAFLVLGALSFGGLFRHERWRRTVPALFLALASVATLQGLAFLGALEQDPLWRHLERFGLGYTDTGTWGATASIASSCFVVPCFLGGTGCALARHPARFGALVLGAALGFLVHPLVRSFSSGPMLLPADSGTPWAWRIGLLGAFLAATGCALLLAQESGRLRVFGFSSMAIALMVGAVSPVRVWTFAPWYRIRLEGELVVPTSAGLLSVMGIPGIARWATLDGRRLTPMPEEERVDERRIRWSFALLGERESPPRVLVVGQLTERRARLLAELGASDLERTAPWFDGLPAVDELLGCSGAGTLVDPAEARASIARGEYDLVLVLPTHGAILFPVSAAYVPWGSAAAPFLEALELPRGTLGVAWLDAAAPLGSRSLGDRVLLAHDGFRHLSIGAVFGRPAPAGAGVPRTLAPGLPVPVPSPARRLRLPGERRSDLLRALVTSRLAEEAGEDASAALARGFATHYRAQRPSSPFESVAESIELEEDALRSFLQALRVEPVFDPFTVALWEDIAALLVRKRLPDLVLAFVEPVAAAYRGENETRAWPGPDLAVGLAYLEVLAPAKALAHLDRALVADPAGEGVAIAAARAARESGDPDGALARLERGTAALPPSRQSTAAGRELRRQYALELDRHGDPRGLELLRGLLRERPDDEELRGDLGLAPLGDPPARPADR